MSTASRCGRRRSTTIWRPAPGSRAMSEGALFPEEVRRLESCEYGLEEFGHREHLKVAWTYLHLYGYAEGLSRMRESLLRFSAHHGRSGYHETITVFWMRKLAAHSREDFDEVLKRATKDALFGHFSRQRVMSEQ